MKIIVTINNRPHFEAFPNWAAACYFIKAMRPSEATLRVVEDESKKDETAQKILPNNFAD